MQRPVHKTASSTSQSVSNASNMKVRSKTAPYREISPRTAVLRQPLPEGTEPDAFQAVAGEDRLRAASCRRESRAPPDISS
jgi:hypothetical protein